MIYQLIEILHMIKELMMNIMNLIFSSIIPIAIVIFILMIVFDAIHNEKEDK